MALHGDGLSGDERSGFSDWQEALAGWTDISASELHGLAVGIICAVEPPTDEEWAQLLRELSFAPLPDDALVLLTQYAEDAAFELADNEDALGFLPVVPDDTHPMRTRLLALKDWAGGFITGLGVSDRHLTKEDNEALKLLSYVAAIRVDDVPNDVPDHESHDGDYNNAVPNDDDKNDEAENESEAHYIELYEFARLAPLQLFTPTKKPFAQLALVKGLAADRKTAMELKREALTDVKMNMATDAMANKTDSDLLH